jgi:hypothetical protein
MKKPAVLLLTLLLAAGMARAQVSLDCHFAPGWEPSGPVRQFTAENLYDYKDGGADGYLIYGFSRMSTIDCKSGSDTLTIDVSEMNDPDAAYGLFTTNRDPRLPIAPIGMGGQIQSQSAIFAKGKYYVEIVEVADNPEADHSTVIKAFVAGLEHRLEGRSTAPEALQWFSQDNLDSVRLIPESVLGLRLLKRGYVAKYKQGQAFVVLETTPESAAEVFKKLRAHFDGATPAQVGNEAFQTKAPYLDGICIFRKGRFLAGYANLPDAQQACALAVKLAARIP